MPDDNSNLNRGLATEAKLGIDFKAGGGDIVDDSDVEIRDTDIVFNCPHCGHSLVIDYRGAGLIISCTKCQNEVQVPIPDGMQLSDIDQEPAELVSQIMKLRRALNKAEERIHEQESLIARLTERRSQLEKSKITQLRGLTDIRNSCEVIQRLNDDFNKAIGRIVEVIQNEMKQS